LGLCCRCSECSKCDEQGPEVATSARFHHDIRQRHICQPVHASSLSGTGERRKGQEHSNADACIQGTLYCCEASWSCLRYAAWELITTRSETDRNQAHKHPSCKVWPTLNIFLSLWRSSYRSSLINMTIRSCPRRF